MNQTLPLKGKSVLVPRGKNEAKSFSTLVEKYGGVPLEIPLIAFRPKLSSSEIHKLLNNLHTYDWIIFTSNVTVEMFFTLLKSRPVSFPKIAAIGKKTAAFLEAKGYQVDFVPNEYVAEGFVREFSSLVEKGMKVLIPKGNLAREYIKDSLIHLNAHVDEVIVYETYLPQESKSRLRQVLLNNELHILTFTSPSTVDHFIEVVNEYGLQKHIEQCIICCIGPVTKEKIESVGLRVDVMPEMYTVDHMLKDVTIYLQSLH